MKNPPNVGKYTIYMDGMGTVDGNQNFGECSPVEGQVVEVPLLFLTSQVDQDFDGILPSTVVRFRNLLRISG